MPTEIDLLRELFYDPRTGLGGLQSLLRVAKENNVRLTQRQIKAWYDRQAVNQQFRPVNARAKKYIPIQCGNNRVASCLQVDLMDLTRKYQKANGNYRFLLTAIDVTSRYAWVFPLKKKTPNEIKPYIQRIYEEMKRVNPSNEQFTWTSDDGREWAGEVKKYLTDNGIPMHLTQRKTTTSMVERFNQTVWKRIRKLQAVAFVDKLPDIVHNYNHTVHSSIGAKPVDVFKGRVPPPPLKAVPGYGIKIGDRVRYQRNIKQFEKRSMKPKYSDAVYYVVDRNKHQYSLSRTRRGNPLSKKYLARELQKVEGDAEVHPARRDEQVPLPAVVGELERQDRSRRRVERDPALAQLRLDPGQAQRLGPQRPRRQADVPIRFREAIG